MTLTQRASYIASDIIYMKKQILYYTSIKLNRLPLFHCLPYSNFSARASRSINILCNVRCNTLCREKVPQSSKFYNRSSHVSFDCSHHLLTIMEGFGPATCRLAMMESELRFRHTKFSHLFWSYLHIFNMVFLPSQEMCCIHFGTVLETFVFLGDQRPRTGKLHVGSFPY